jgi:hypothetical protein
MIWLGQHNDRFMTRALANFSTLNRAKLSRFDVKIQSSSASWRYANNCFVEFSFSASRKENIFWFFEAVNSTQTQLALLNHISLAESRPITVAGPAGEDSIVLRIERLNN